MFKIAQHIRNATTQLILSVSGLLNSKPNDFTIVKTLQSTVTDRLEGCCADAIVLLSAHADGCHVRRPQQNFEVNHARSEVEKCRTLPIL
jgi:hypothetical protein